jgi:site-specific DNA-methyltransferase (adenine-specific)
MDEYINKIIHADCMEILKQLPDKCVDLVLTDPPYGGGSSGGGVINGQINHEADLAAGLKNTISRTGGTWAKKYQIGGIFSHDIRHWDIAPTQEVFDEIFRVSKNQIIWGGNYFNLPPTRCFNIWKKLTISQKFSMAMAEYAWCSFNANAKLWEYAPQDSNRFHPTQKPVALIARQIEEYSKEGDLILDCFSGSGTTAVACHNLNRRFICIEKNKEYYEASVKRLEQVQQQQLLF